ncbi:hypothetical protein JXQ70_07795 [bacterium]|nr:hypothetical protein [bacterium]
MDPFRGKTMLSLFKDDCSRRVFIQSSLYGAALGSLFGNPIMRGMARGEETQTMPEIKAVVRPETLFAGIRKPIKKRAELEPRIELLKKTLGNTIEGPLTHIFRFDTPVDGYDSEIGFPVCTETNTEDIKTHRLRSMSFFSALHEGPLTTLGQTTTRLYEHMNKVGLSPELELVEIYHNWTPDKPSEMKIENMASYLAWSEVYQQQLIRVLGREHAASIWLGGEKISPFTLVDERANWVKQTIDQLKKVTTVDQQFDILSRVALVRPSEDVLKYKAIYEQNREPAAVFTALNQALSQTRTGGFVDQPRHDGKILHLSKVPYNGEAYQKAQTPIEFRKAYCFCALVREASNPQIDPIFCYRAAGWDRQFWEPILGMTFQKCIITHSILKGDRFCAWDYHLT